MNRTCGSRIGQRLTTKTPSTVSSLLSQNSRANSLSRASAISRRRIVSDLTATGLAVAGIVSMAGAAYAAGTNPFKNPRDLTHNGMTKFMNNQVEESIKDFDEVIQLDPKRTPYMWQRGLSLYYVGRYREAAEQFRVDVAVNPNDTEEAVWAYLAEARDPAVGPERARETFLKVGVDPRPVMRTVHDVFKHNGDPDTILKAAEGDKNPKGGHDRFYALLYHALYHESEGHEALAKKSMLEAVRTDYGAHSGDYMSALAKVHCLRRGWL